MSRLAAELEFGNLKRRLEWRADKRKKESEAKSKESATADPETALLAQTLSTEGTGSAARPEPEPIHARYPGAFDPDKHRYDEVEMGAGISLIERADVGEIEELSNPERYARRRAAAAAALARRNDPLFMAEAMLLAGEEGGEGGNAETTQDAIDKKLDEDVSKRAPSPSTLGDALRQDEEFTYEVSSAEAAKAMMNVPLYVLEAQASDEPPPGSVVKANVEHDEIIKEHRERWERGKKDFIHQVKTKYAPVNVEVEKDASYYDVSGVDSRTTQSNLQKIRAVLRGGGRDNPDYAEDSDEARRRGGSQSDSMENSKMSALDRHQWRLTQERIRELQQRVSTLEAELSDERREHEQRILEIELGHKLRHERFVATHQDEIMELESQIKDLEVESKRQREAIKYTEEELRKTKKEATERLAEQSRELNAEIEQLTWQRDAARQAAASFEEEINGHKEDAHQARAEAQQHRDAAREHQKAMEESQEAMKRLASELMQSQEEMKKVTAEQEALQEEVKQVADRSSELQQQLDAAHEEVAAANAKQEEAVAAEQAKVEELAAVVQSAVKEGDSKTQEIVILKEQLVVERTKNAKLERRSSQLDKVLSQFEHETERQDEANRRAAKHRERLLHFICENGVLRAQILALKRVSLDDRLADALNENKWLHDELRKAHRRRITREAFEMRKEKRHVVRRLSDDGDEEEGNLEDFLVIDDVAIQTEEGSGITRQPTDGCTQTADPDLVAVSAGVSSYMKSSVHGARAIDLAAAARERHFKKKPSPTRKSPSRERSRESAQPTLKTVDDDEEVESVLPTRRGTGAPDSATRIPPRPASAQSATKGVHSAKRGVSGSRPSSAISTRGASRPHSAASQRGGSAAPPAPMLLLTGDATDPSQQAMHPANYFVERRRLDQKEQEQVRSALAARDRLQFMRDADPDFDAVRKSMLEEIGEEVPADEHLPTGPKSYRKSMVAGDPVMGGPETAFAKNASGWLPTEYALGSMPVFTSPAESVKSFKPSSGVPSGAWRPKNRSSLS